MAFPPIAFCDLHRVARLTLQTRTLWLVSRPTVALVMLACVSFHCVFPVSFFFAGTKKMEKNINKKKEASTGYLPRLLKNMFFGGGIVTRNRAAIEAKKKLDPKGHTRPCKRLTCTQSHVP